MDKNNWAKTMERIVLHLKLVLGVPLAYVVQCHIKFPHVMPRYDFFLNLDEDMIARAPIVDETLHIKFA